MATTDSTTENTAENTTPEVEVSAPEATPAKKAPAKRTPRKSTPKAAAKKAPAKKATEKKVGAAPGRKVRWTETQEFKNGKNQTGTGLGGTKYQIVRSNDGEYAARVTTAKGAKTDLVKGTFSAAYWACVNNNKANVERHDSAASKRAAKKAAVPAA